MKTLNRLTAFLCLMAISAASVAAGPGLDLTFGQQGIVTTNILGLDHGSAIGSVYGKRIVVSGFTWGGASDWDYALAGYRIDGKLDTFGTAGKTITQLGTLGDIAEAMAIQTDGRIVVVGSSQTGPSKRAFSIVRYTFSGHLDTSFGNGGKKIVPVGSGLGGALAVAIQSDGKILVAGTTNVDLSADFTVVRLTSAGAFDNTFGTGGRVTTDVGKFNDVAGAIVVQPDKKIVVAGTSGDSTSGNFAYSLVRYLPNGKLDTGFGIGGIVVKSYGDHATRVRSIGQQSGGRLVVGGLGKFNAQERIFTMMGFNSVGKLDQSFGVHGIVNTPIANPSAPSLPMLIRPDDKIIAAGFSSPVFTGFGITGYDSKGALIGSYGTNGPIAQYGDRASGIALQQDGKILVTGTVNFGSPGTGDDIAIARYSVNW